MKKVLCSFALLGLLSPNISNAGIWYVNSGATGSANGTSWTNAFKDLQSAIDQAGAGDTIWVAQGTYKPSVAADGLSTNDRDKAFVLKDNIHIFGGFKGTESKIADRNTDSTSLFVTNPTILDGDLGTANDSTDNAYHVIVATQISGFSMNGFIVQNANGDDSSSLTVKGNKIYRHYGGGIHNDDATGTYSNMLIRKNTVASPDNGEGGGGGMYNNGGVIIISQSTFYKNMANNCNGGAMENEFCNAQIMECWFKNNSATGEDEGGGAIDNREGSNAVITNTVFENNFTANSGGGIYNDDSKPVLNDVLFINNTALSSGGGMDCDGGSDAVLKNVKFINNTAEEDGGGLYSWKSNPNLTNVTFDGNHADNNGGGMYSYNTCNPVVTNSTFINNSAGNDYGGYGLERNSTGIITNSLFARNTAGNNGGGLGSHDIHGTQATLIVTNATIANNVAINGGGGYDRGLTTQIRNSIIIGNYPEDVDINPVLALNARYSVVGDDTDVVFIEDGSVNPQGTHMSSVFFVDSTNNDYRLVSNSMAVDGGDSSFFNVGQMPDLSNITTDGRGADRIMGANIDLGAYEFCTQTVAPDASITVSPSNTVMENSSVTFTATISDAGNNPRIEWYNNGTLIAGESAATYTAVAGVDFIDGDEISVEVYSSDPCADPESVTSNKEKMNVEKLPDDTTGINSYSINRYNLNVYPNPNNGVFTISANLNVNKGYQIMITNTLGQQVYAQKIQPAQSSVKLNIAPAGALAQGFYILTVREEGGAGQALHFVVQ